MSKKIIIKTNKPIWPGINEPNSILEVSPPNLVVGEPVITNRLIIPENGHIGHIGSECPTALLHISTSSESNILSIDSNAWKIGTGICDPISISPSFKEPFKLNFKKVKNLKGLLWLLNEIDLHINSSHKNYDELKSRFL